MKAEKWYNLVIYINIMKILVILNNLVKNLYYNTNKNKISSYMSESKITVHQGLLSKSSILSKTN